MNKVLTCISLIIAALCSTSCSHMGAPDLSDTNAKFYGTEWSTSKQAEGLKFSSDNSVLYFSSTVSKSGTFKYYSEQKWIEFDGLTVTGSLPAEFEGAEVVSDTQINVHWHELGKSEGYYMKMYKRR